MLEDEEFTTAIFDLQGHIFDKIVRPIDTFEETKLYIDKNKKRWFNKIQKDFDA